MSRACRLAFGEDAVVSLRKSLYCSESILSEEVPPSLVPVENQTCVLLVGTQSELAYTSYECRLYAKSAASRKALQNCQPWGLNCLQWILSPPPSPLGQTDCDEIVLNVAPATARIELATSCVFTGVQWIITGLLRALVEKGAGFSGGPPSCPVATTIGWCVPDPELVHTANVNDGGRRLGAVGRRYCDGNDYNSLNCNSKK
eukprot:1424081-Amphidinium_carterae.1